MSYFQLKLPPGMSRPGTVYDARGRWYGGNLVRWFSRVFQAWSGWVPVRSSAGPINLGAPIRGMHAWRRNAGASLLALGTPTKLYIFGTSTLSDETPGGFTTGNAHATQTSGAFGTGAFGAGPYGVGDPAEDTLVEANSWQFDNYHEDLIAWAYSDRKIYLYDSSAGTCAALTNAPTNNSGAFVTPEGFVVALGPSGVPREYAFADPDDPTIWTPAVDNLAGDGLIRSEGLPLVGRGTSRESLIWTDVDLHAMRFVGGEFIYSVQLIGRCSLISRRAIGIFNDKAFWMGDRGFFLYDGEVKPVASEVSDYVFNDLNRTQASKIHAVPLASFQEIVVFYPSASSVECDRYVVYNWAENFMYVGDLERTSGVDEGVYPYPTMADAKGLVYRHEVPGADRPRYDATSTVFEGHSTPDGDSGVGLYTGGGGIGTRAAETFSTDGGIVSSIGFYLSKVGSPPNTIVAHIYSVNGGLDASPGTVYATTATVSASSLSAHPTPGWVTFTFATPFVLPAGVYAVVVVYDDGDASNYVRVWHGTNDYEGTSWYYTTAWDDVDADHMFRVTGYGATLVTPHGISGPVELGQGDLTMDISQYLPDQKTLGDSNLTVYAAYFPTGAETTHGPFTAANPTDMRINARQIRIRVDEVTDGWRFGTPRFQVEPGSPR